MRLWMPVMGYMAFLFVLSTIRETPQDPGGVDKDVHGLLYAGLAVLTMRALAGGWRAPMTLTHAVLAIVIATLYGISDEWHQSFVPPRESDWLDVVADAAGASLAAVACVAWSALGRARGTRGV
jgi:VanZ family protein